MIHQGAYINFGRGGTKNSGKIYLVKLAYLEFGDPPHKRAVEFSDPPHGFVSPLPAVVNGHSLIHSEKKRVLKQYT